MIYYSDFQPYAAPVDEIARELNSVPTFLGFPLSVIRAHFEMGACDVAFNGRKLLRVRMVPSCIPEVRRRSI